MSLVASKSCTFRANPADLDRCDALIPHLGTGPLARSGPITRTTVIKIALSYGLERLEQELGVRPANPEPAIDPGTEAAINGREAAQFMAELKTALEDLSNDDV